MVVTGMARKILGDKELLFSDTLMVYINWTVSGEAVVSSRTHLGIVVDTKPSQDTLNCKEATLCQTGWPQARC